MHWITKEPLIRVKVPLQMIYYQTPPLWIQPPGHVRVKAWTYLFCSGGLVCECWGKVRRGRKLVGGGL